MRIVISIASYTAFCIVYQKRQCSSLGCLYNLYALAFWLRFSRYGLVEIVLPSEMVCMNKVKDIPEYLYGCLLGVGSDVI